MGDMAKNIRFLRKEKGWTQDELGAKLDPKVNKAAITKWESGKVENIKRNHIAQMSKLFNIRPSELMGFEDYKDNTVQFDSMTGHKLLYYLQELNKDGQDRLLDYLEELTQIDKYRK